MRACSFCGCEITAQSKTGRCRSCVFKDPELAAKRGEAIRRAFYADPAKRERHRKGTTEANRRPESRARSGRLAKEIRLWEKGLPRAQTPEARARQARAQSERKLAHIPLAHREEYQQLAKRIGAKDAARIILEHADAIARRRA